VGVPLEADGISVERLQIVLRTARPKLVYLIPDFQNPAGVTLSLEKRRAIAELALAGDCLIVEDVPYRDLRYAGETPPLIRTFAPDCVLTLGSFSKTICPGVRVGYAVGNAAVVQRLTRFAEDTYLSPVITTQAAAGEFLARELRDPNIARLIELYRPRWRAAIDATQELPVRHAFKPDGGFFLSLFFADSANTVDLVERAAALGVVISPGRGFFPEFPESAPENDKRSFLRLAFQGIAPDRISMAVRVLNELVRA
jgi:DNA-binding transcriptional MocR family regulator